MTEIKKPEAYFGKMVKNSDRNEFRANDNYFKYISSVGNEVDLQLEASKGKHAQEHITDFIEQQLCEADIDNWLLFMENEQLHKALTELSRPELRLLYVLIVHGLTHREAANLYSVSHTTVGKKYRQIISNIKLFFKNAE